MEYEELTRKIIGCCFEVIHDLGSGFLESVYEKALVIALRDKGLSAREQVPFQVNFRGQDVGDYFADLIVEDTVIVELKAVKTLLGEHQAQVINYLRATQKPVGLLVNFGSSTLEIKRLNRYGKCQTETAPSHP